MQLMILCLNANTSREGDRETKVEMLSNWTNETAFAPGDAGNEILLIHVFS